MERVVAYVPLPLLDWINILYFLQANGSFLCDSFVNKLADKNPMQSLIASRHSSFFDKNWIAFLTKIIFKQVSPFNFMKNSHLKNQPRLQRISLFLGFRTQGLFSMLAGTTSNIDSTISSSSSHVITSNPSPLSESQSFLFSRLMTLPFPKNNRRAKYHPCFTIFSLMINKK